MAANRRQSAIESRQGTVMMFSLLVLSAVMVAATGLSTLIINSLQQTKTLDRAAIAYYAAESAVERTIWEVRRPDEPDAPPPLSVPDPSLPAITEIKLPNNSSWTRTVTIEEDEVRLAIPRDSFFEMHLFEPSEALGTLKGWQLGADTVDHLEVEWGDPFTVCDPDGECPSLVAEWLRWSVDDLAQDEGIRVFTKRYSPQVGTPGKGVATIPPADPDYGGPIDLTQWAYRIRLRAEYGDLRNVVIRAEDQFNDPAKVPGRIKVEGFGRFAGITQKITVRIPRRSPLSSLFDFAVFSECSLVKGFPISCP